MEKNNIHKEQQRETYNQGEYTPAHWDNNYLIPSALDYFFPPLVLR